MQEKFVRQDGKLHLIKSEDIKPHLKEAQIARSEVNQTGELRRVGIIPAVEVLELREKHGIDVFNLNKESEAKLRRLLNTDYKYLKTINGKA